MSTNQTLLIRVKLQTVQRNILYELRAFQVPGCRSTMFSYKANTLEAETHSSPVNAVYTPSSSDDDLLILPVAAEQAQKQVETRGMTKALSLVSRTLRTVVNR